MPRRDRDAPNLITDAEKKARKERENTDMQVGRLAGMDKGRMIDALHNEVPVSQSVAAARQEAESMLILEGEKEEPVITRAVKVEDEMIEVIAESVEEPEEAAPSEAPVEDVDEVSGEEAVEEEEISDEDKETDSEDSVAVSGNEEDENVTESTKEQLEAQIAELQEQLKEKEGEE